VDGVWCSEQHSTGPLGPSRGWICPRPTYQVTTSSASCPPYNPFSVLPPGMLRSAQFPRHMQGSTHPQLRLAPWCAHRGTPLPCHEDFGDAFSGKALIRFPGETPSSVHGPTARLRRNPRLGSHSLWLPDHCIVGSNTLEWARESRRGQRRPVSSMHRGLAANPANFG
jgi:hypothetical protein